MSDANTETTGQDRPKYTAADAAGFFDWLQGEYSGVNVVDHDLSLTQKPSLAGILGEAELELFGKLWDRLARMRARNVRLNRYYEGEASLRNAQIGVPAKMMLLGATAGWPAKAVQMLARKHVFEGYALAGESDPYKIGGLLARNQFPLELGKAINAAYKHGVAFLAVLSDGAGGVHVSAHSADLASALYDEANREITAALTVDATDDKTKAPIALTIYLPEAVVVLARDGAVWRADRQSHGLGRVPVEPLVNDPQLGRPFGSSRITREVRYLTDAAIRTLLRAETSAEFFAAPQRYALGVDEDAFADRSGWESVIGRLWAIEPNENGDIPSVGQFPQLSMEPHLSMYRQLAQNFCSATNLPMSAVGLFADNPASAEAMQAAEYALSDEAEYQWRVFSDPLRRVLQDVVFFADNEWKAIPDESWNIDIRWTPARYVSPQAASDFIVKVASVFEDIKATDVAKRRAGFTQAEIDEMNAQGRRANALDTLERMAGIARVVPATEPAGGDSGGGQGEAGLE